MIAVVDYRMGNVHSVRNALETVGADVVVTNEPQRLRDADRILLPGVGAFAECMDNLTASGVIETLHEEVVVKGKPLLGICVGLQLLTRESDEQGIHSGLGWLNASVKRFRVEDQGLKVPHVGWNEVTETRSSELMKGLRSSPTFYFVHAYRPVTEDPDIIVATCDYGAPFPAVMEKDNIAATQFHPEKSQRNGLQLLENFLSWEP